MDVELERPVVVVVVFLYLIENELDFEFFPTNFSVFFAQRQHFYKINSKRKKKKICSFTHGWCCDEEMSDDHKEGVSRSTLANEDTSDQPTGGNGNDGKTGESESVERVADGEKILCTGDREHVDWDDDHKSLSFNKHKIISFYTIKQVLLTAKLEQ